MKKTRFPPFLQDADKIENHFFPSLLEEIEGKLGQLLSQRESQSSFLQIC